MDEQRKSILSVLKEYYASSFWDIVREDALVEKLIGILKDAENIDISMKDAICWKKQPISPAIRISELLMPFNRDPPTTRLSHNAVVTCYEFDEKLWKAFKGEPLTIKFAYSTGSAYITKEEKATYGEE